VRASTWRATTESQATNVPIAPRIGVSERSFPCQRKFSGAGGEFFESDLAVCQCAAADCRGLDHLKARLRLGLH